MYYPIIFNQTLNKLGGLAKYCIFTFSISSDYFANIIQRMEKTVSEICNFDDVLLTTYYMKIKEDRDLLAQFGSFSL